MEHYMKIYSALFESHLGYGISVWGVALKNQTYDKLFVTQKHCIRILFGDLEAYLEKQATCARARPYGQQKLGADFYIKEHTKPIFNKLKILTAQNLFKYHCILDIFKILKFRTPYSLYELVYLSKRDTSYCIILPKLSNTFLYQGSKLWNLVCKRIINFQDGFSISIATVKTRTKAIIMESQSMHTSIQWVPDNFQIAPITHENNTQFSKHLGISNSESNNLNVVS